MRAVVRHVGMRSPIIHAVTGDALAQSAVHLAVQARATAQRGEAETLILPVLHELVLLGADATARDGRGRTAEALARALSLPRVAAVLSLIESPAAKLQQVVTGGADEEALRVQLQDMQANGSLAAAIDGKGRDGLSLSLYLSSVCLSVCLSI